jgi:hypothetical protein
MKGWFAGVLAALAIACGDAAACQEADQVAEEIRLAAALDGITGAPCVEGSTEGLSDTRRAEYAKACARYQELKAKCDG